VGSRLTAPLNVFRPRAFDETPRDDLGWLAFRRIPPRSRRAVLRIDDSPTCCDRMRRGRRGVRQRTAPGTVWECRRVSRHRWEPVGPPGAATGRRVMPRAGRRPCRMLGRSPRLPRRQSGLWRAGSTRPLEDTLRSRYQARRELPVSVPSCSGPSARNGLLSSGRLRPRPRVEPSAAGGAPALGVFRGPIFR
jgi:hypothetical protein